MGSVSLHLRWMLYRTRYLTKAALSPSVSATPASSTIGWRIELTPFGFILWSAGSRRGAPSQWRNGKRLHVSWRKNMPMCFAAWCSFYARGLN